MKRGHQQERSPAAVVARTMLVVALAMVVLWQFGHSFVPGQDEGSPAPADPAQAYITTSEVNLRSGPGTSHDVLSVLPLKTEVAVTGAVKFGFAPVVVNGQQAWVAADYLAPEGSVLAATEEIPTAVVPEPTVMPTEAPTQESAPEIRVANIAVEESTGGVPVDVAEVVEEPAPQRVVTTSGETVTVAEDVPDEAPSGERWIEIDRTRSTVTLHDGARIVAVYDGLMGKDPSQDGYYATAVGTHYVFSMEKALTETPFAPGVYLTDWVGFDPERSNGIHSPVRDAAGNVVVTGGTVTLGCVRVGADEARAVFDFAYIGMRVEVHD